MDFTVLCERVYRLMCGASGAAFIYTRAGLCSVRLQMLRGGRVCLARLWHNIPPFFFYNVDGNQLGRLRTFLSCERDS